MSEATPRPWRVQVNERGCVEILPEGQDPMKFVRMLTAHDGLVAALEGLVSRIDQLMPTIDDAFAFRQIHGITYSGPTWAKALAAARAALRAATGEG